MSRLVPIKAGALYFVIVFGIAFALGVIRVLWIVPRIGARAAEISELVLLLPIVFVAARAVVRWLSVPPAVSARLGMGGTAVLLALLFDFTLVLYLRGMTLTSYFQNLDPVSGSAYYALLGIFALMPCAIAPGRRT